MPPAAVASSLHDNGKSSNMTRLWFEGTLTCRKFGESNDIGIYPRPLRRPARSKVKSSGRSSGRKRTSASIARKVVCLATAKERRWYWEPRNESISALVYRILLLCGRFVDPKF